ncbi:MAG: hypothetical protein QGF34_00015 [Candidatus Poseidoniaceae archaeon]|jgi:hypothetical protein|nr:hypothetical protein [Candidatus Poseidoniaceae archaeon]
MEKQNDTLAQVGIGAMIVFIGIIIAVTSSMYVMINQLERISQGAEEAVSVATNEAHTQVIFVGGWVDDEYDDFLLMFEYQSLGKNVQTDEVAWVLWCEFNGEIFRRMGYMGDQVFSAPIGTDGERTTIWEVGAEILKPDELISGKRYFVIADGGTGTDSGNGAFCGPEWIFDRGVTAYYSIYLPDGGHTTQELRVNVFEVGQSVT